LFYSSGKDSICLLDICAQHFKKVFIVNMFFVENLEHINKYLEFSKIKYKNVEVITIEHWTMTHLRRAGVYQLPQTKAKLKKLIDTDNELRLLTGCNLTCYGMKKSDSLHRNLMLKTYPENGMFCEKTNKIYPLSNWTNKEVLAYIKQHKLPEPITYTQGKKSQGLGFNIDCFLFLERYYPNDLQEIYKKYPFSRQILFSYHNQNE
jgi:sulfate adenylyltransferase subunit 2